MHCIRNNGNHVFSSATQTIELFLKYINAGDCAIGRVT